MIGVICNNMEDFRYFKGNQPPGIRELLHCVSNNSHLRGRNFTSVIRIGGSMELLHDAERRIVDGKTLPPGSSGDATFLSVPRKYVGEVVALIAELKKNERK